MVKLYVYKLDLTRKKSIDKNDKKCSVLYRTVTAVETLDGYISKLLPIIFDKKTIGKDLEDKVICRGDVWWMFTSTPNLSTQDVFLKSIYNFLRNEQSICGSADSKLYNKLKLVFSLIYNRRTHKEDEDEN